MRADLRALVWIEAALEKIAHDARLNELPISFTSSCERADFLFVQLENCCLLKEMAVEMTNLVPAKTAAGRHCREQFFKRFGEMLRIIHSAFENLRDEIRGKQTRVFSEKTEYDAV